MSETPAEEIGPPDDGTNAEPGQQATPPPQTTSNLLKVQRALGGDDMWKLRMEIAFQIAGIPDTRENQIAVTKDCVEAISCDIYGTVTCEGVTDEQLETAVANLATGE